MSKNILVACSNLYGLRAYYIASNPLLRILLIMSITSSFMYHLVEFRKHGIDGLSKFGCFTSCGSHNVLINFDRLCAFLLGIYFLVNGIFDEKIIIVGCIAIIFGMLSELVFINKIYLNYYVVSHILWHFLIFHAVYLLTINSMCY